MAPLCVVVDMKLHLILFSKIQLELYEENPAAHRNQWLNQTATSPLYCGLN